MKLTGKFIIFVEDKHVKDGVIKVFSTSVSKKQENGSYVNATIGVRFGKTNFPNERLEKLQMNKCYTFDVTNAWLDVRAYTTKDGKAGREIFIHIEEATPVESKEVIHKDIRASLPEDLPF